MGVRRPTLLGRAAEVETLLAAVGAGLAGEGPALVLVVGESGIGKSRLAATLMEPYALTGDPEPPVVCRGAAMPGGEATALLPWADALQQAVTAYGSEVAARAAGPALSQLAVLLPGLDPSARIEPDGRAADVLPWYVGRLAAERPLVVLLDDLHLADPASLTTLSRLVDQAPPGLVVVATAQPVEGSAPATEAWAGHAVRLRRMATTIELGALADAAAAMLVEQLAAGSDDLGPAAVSEIVHRAEGNPFFIHELVAVRVSGRGTVPTAEVLGLRLSVLTPQALAVAEAVAVHGAGVPHEMLRELVGLDDASLLEGLRELVAAGLVVGDTADGGYAFRHVLVGDAVRERMLPVERRRLHAGCARAVEAALAEASPARRRRLLGQLPPHWAEAGQLDQALTAAVRAAQASAAVDPDVAAAHYARALDLDARLGPVAGSARPTRAQLLEWLAEQRGAAGDGAAATESAQAALALVDGAADAGPTDAASAARLHRLVAVHGEGVLADAEVAAAFEAAVRAAESLGPSPELAAALAAQARHQLVLDHNADAVPLSRQARDIAISVGADPEEALAAATLGASLCYLGQFAEGLQTLAYAVPALEAAQRPYDAARALLTLVWAQFHSGDPLTARAGAERAALAMRDGGGPRDVAARLEAAGLEMAVAQGHWDHAAQALARLDPAGETDPADDVTTVEGALLRSVRAELALRRGQLREAGAGYSAVLAHWERLGLRAYDASSLARLGEIAVAGGEVATARAYLDDGLDAVEAADTWVAVLGFARAGLAVEAAAARSGRPVEVQRCHRLVALLERGSVGAPVGSVADAERAVAVAERSRVDGRDDPEAWGEAVAAWSTLGFPWWRAAALLRQAEALVATRGARREASDLVADVLATADLLGAAGLQVQAGDLARRAGLDLPARSPDIPPPRSPGDEGGSDRPVPDALELLSAREREVVLLLSGGASNRRIAEQLFISEKTASVHVSHILAKLGVSSRLEAAAVVHRGLAGRSS